MVCGAEVCFGAVGMDPFRSKIRDGSRRLKVFFDQSAVRSAQVLVVALARPNLAPESPVDENRVAKDQWQQDDCSNKTEQL